MEVTEEGAGPLLNPFPFATETYFRFGFLLIVALVTTVSAGLLTSLALVSDYGGFERCLKEVESSYLATPAHMLESKTGEVRGAINGIKACFEKIPTGSLLLWPGVLVAALFSGAAGFALADRAVKIRAHALKPLPPELEDLIRPRVDLLAGKLGLMTRPNLYLMPLRSDANAFAFGRNGRPALALTLGAVLRAVQAPASFDVLAAHELSHASNRDLTIHLVTRSVVHSFLWFVLPIYAILAILEPVTEGSWRGVWAGVGNSDWLVLNEVIRVALAALLILLARNSVSRARERYADLRAATVPHVREEFDAVLAERGPRPLWQLPFATSPQTDARRRGLVSSDDLFSPQIATAMMFGFGLSLSILVVFLVTNLLWYNRFLDSLESGHLGTGRPLSVGSRFGARPCLQRVASHRSRGDRATPTSCEAGARMSL